MREIHSRHPRFWEAVVAGANAVVLEDVPDGATVVGVPARITSD